MTRLLHAEEPLPERRPLPSAEEIAQLPPDGGDEFNRLIFEQSPYLLQHARNPVDWYPWGDEAFMKAEAENKLIFLSIGYSTCHWCHVMEAESFEDGEVAEILNRDYVCIKVDREERPDLDDYFMRVTSALTGQGGWPNTLFLTPDRKPIFAATYISKTDKFGRPGLIQILPRMAQIWLTEKESIKQRTDAVMNALLRSNTAQPGGMPSVNVLDSAYAALKARFDSQYGGFGSAPKFPTPHDLSFLARYWKRSSTPEAMQMVLKTLINMRLGGIYDHVGYGFHRYATDQQWLIPHFEKMLYDQALIALAMIDAYQATENPLVSRTISEIFAYVMRDMTSPEGAFYSAEDADSPAGEGDFYLWTAQEARNTLGTLDGEWFIHTFGLREEGNWTVVQDRKKNIVHLRSLADAMLNEDNIAIITYAARWDKVREQLFAEREKRERPHLDDKILCDWNGLMIAALAKGGRVLDNALYTDAARKAAEFTLAKLRKQDGTLYHRYRNGEAGIDGMLDDYAFLVWGLLELYEATFDAAYLKEARALSEKMLALFQGEDHGALHMTSPGAKDLPLRPLASYDGAIPAGNSVAALNLLRLGRVTADFTLENAAQDIFKALSARIESSPDTQTHMLQALDFALGPSYEVVIVGKRAAEDTQAMLRALNKAFLPNKVVILKEPDDTAIGELAPYTIAHESLNGQATAYVCRDFACELPTVEIAKMLELLGVKPADDSEINPGAPGQP